MQYQRNKENIPGSVPLPDQHRNWMGSIMSWNPSSIQTNQHGWRHNLCVSVLRTTENIFNGKLSNGNVQWGKKILFYVIFAFTYQDVKFCIYIFKKYFPINSVIMISTILPRATLPGDTEQNRDHGIHTKGSKHKKLLNYTRTQPLPGRLYPFGPFLRKTQPSLFGQIKLCTDKNMFFVVFLFFYIGGWWGRGGAKCAKLYECCPISGISCLHSCDALGTMSDQWAFHSTSNYK